MAAKLVLAALIALGLWLVAAATWSVSMAPYARSQLGWSAGSWLIGLALVATHVLRRRPAAESVRPPAAGVMVAALRTRRQSAM